MARRDNSPDFIEALARGLDVIRAFCPSRPVMSLAAVAAATGLPRPTARRILLTLEELGYVRSADGGFRLTPRVLDLGMRVSGTPNKSAEYSGRIGIRKDGRPESVILAGHRVRSRSAAMAADRPPVSGGTCRPAAEAARLSRASTAAAVPQAWMVKPTQPP